MTISDNPLLNSGLARVHRHVLDGLISEKHTIYPCVWFGYDSQQIQKLRNKEKVDEIFYKGKKMFALPKENQAGMMATSQIVEDLNPDWVITIGDYWNFFFFKSLKTRMDYSFKWFPYLTIEQENIDDKWKPLFEHADLIASPTHFGVDSIQKFGVKAHYVPYGVDPVFKPLDPEKRKEIRQERGLSEKVRFITVAQNTVRKNLPSIFFAVKELVSRNKNLADKLSFHIHTNLSARDPLESYVYDLLKLAEQLNIMEYFTFPMSDTSIFSKTCPVDEEMALEYGISDYLLLPSSSEGFGLPILEAMACGVPCVGANNTGITEHLASRGILIDTKPEIYPPCLFVNAVDGYTVADAIEKATLITNCDKYTAMAEESKKYAAQMTWKGMSNKLLELIKEVRKDISIPIEVV